MNKIKLLSSLSTVMFASMATPIIATSCSSSDSLQIIIDSSLSDKEIVSGDKGYIQMSCVAYNNETVTFKNVNASCNNEDVVCKVTSEAASYSTGEIQVDVPESIKPGTICTITITCEDDKGHKAQQGVNIEVIDHKYSINIQNTDGTDPFQPITSELGGKVIIMNTPTIITKHSQKTFNIGVVNGTRTDDDDVIGNDQTTLPYATIDGFATTLVYNTGILGNKSLSNEHPQPPSKEPEAEIKNYWSLVFDLYNMYSGEETAGKLWTTIDGLYLAEAEATVHFLDDKTQEEVTESITSYFLVLIIMGVE